MGCDGRKGRRTQEMTLVVGRLDRSDARTARRYSQRAAVARASWWAGGAGAHARLATQRGAVKHAGMFAHTARDLSPHSTSCMLATSIGGSGDRAGETFADTVSGTAR
jgi:hypothetical protein